ncbi:MAG: S-layer homology domain-containing protein [Clostridia bacterium]|nr:S-layer homology domain-containing protein [Clostridia bacterium]
MKFGKRIIAAIMLFVFVAGIQNASYALGERDALEIIYANTLDGATQGGYNSSGAFLGSMTNGASYYYKNVDFGKISPTYVEVGIGVPDEYAGSVFQLMIDKPDGDVIAEFDAVSSGDFNTSLVRRFELKKSVTGTHDLYMKKLSGMPTNIFTFQFFAPLSGENVFEVYDGTGYFTDIKDSRYKTEIEALKALEVIIPEPENTLFYPQLYVTRLSFAKMLYRLMNDNWYDDAEKRYKDMPDDAESNAAVNYLVDEGILSVSGVYFEPNGFVTIASAYEMLLRVLGYGPVLKEGGSSVLSAAQKAGLTAGVSTNGKLRNEEAAVVLYNAAVAECMPYDILSSFANEEDEVLITKTMGYKTGSGQVTANAYTSLAAPLPKIVDSDVMIGDEIYSVGSTNAKSLLGYDCDFFYTDDAGDYTLRYIAPKKNTAAKEINSVEYDITNITTKVIEYDNAKEQNRKINLKDDTVIIYNGMAIDRKLSDMIDSLPLRGSVRYIQNTKSANVLFIEEYSNIIIDYLDTSEGVIMDEITEKELKYEDGTDRIYAVKNGENVRIKDIKNGDVCMLYVSKNTAGEKLIRLVAGGGRFEGSVMAVSEDRVTIDAVEYKKAYELSDEIAVGTNVEYYLNAAGEIVKIKHISNAENIGVYLGSYIDDNDKLYIRVFTTDNKTAVFECAEKLYVDGVRSKSPENGKSMLDACAVSIDKTVIRYSVSKNAVKMVDTINNAAENVYDVLERRKAGVEYQYESGGRVLVNKSNGKVDGIFAANGRFLNIEGDASDIDNYMFTGVSGIVTSLTGDLYCFDRESKYIDIFVVKGRSEDQENPAVFDSIYSGLNEDDEICHFIKCISSKGSVEYIVRDEDLKSDDLAVIKSLKRGDWISVKKNRRNEIVSLQIVYAGDGQTGREYVTSSGRVMTHYYTLNETTYATGNNNQDNRMVMGIVTDKFDSYIEITHGDGTTELISGANVSCVKVQEYESPVSGLNISNIKKGDLVASCIKFRRPVEIVVLNY